MLVKYIKRVVSYFKVVLLYDCRTRLVLSKLSPYRSSVASFVVPVEAVPLFVELVFSR